MDLLPLIQFDFHHEDGLGSVYNLDCHHRWSVTSQSTPSEFDDVLHTAHFRCKKCGLRIAADVLIKSHTNSGYEPDDD